jgi:(4S)-4-hydroxy-5-phosphonooxypentane-2,3-dione isomerase
MIVLVARYYLRSPSDLPAVKDALAKMAERVREAEPGCRLYQVSRSTENDDVVLLYEHYDDQAALEVHRETQHFKEIIEGRVMPLLDRRERELYELLLS